MEFLILLIKIIIVFNIMMGLASTCTWIERKGSALIQDRIGANRAGAYFEMGNLLVTDVWFLKPISWLLRTFVLAPVFVFIRIAGFLGIINTLLCDAAKAILKEDFVPDGTSNFMHSLAPFMAVFPVFLAFAIVPIAPDFELFGYSIRMQIAQLNAGVLFLLGMGSIAVYGVVIAGWTGNNKFSLLGALRASAQMISYELAMGLAFVSVVIWYGTLDLYEMVESQKGLLNWGIFRFFPLGALTCLILFVSGLAETKRAPFDMPESESELVAGYFTEYSGMKFLLFWLGEFTEIALFSFILVLLFFGGWDLPFIDRIPLADKHWGLALIGHMVLMAKVLCLCVFQITIRWSLPRFRYDQVMKLGWKMLLPLAIVNLIVTAALKLWSV